jgi:hypothetical protein
MKPSNLRSLAVLGGLLLATILAIYHRIPTEKGKAGRMPISAPLRDPMPDISNSSNTRQTTIPQTKLLRKSKQEWLEWIKDCHPFEIENRAIVQMNMEAFQKIGFEAGGGVTADSIRQGVQNVWGSEMDVAKFQKDGISQIDPDFMPKLVSVTETASTFHFGIVNPERSYSRYETLKGRINGYLKWASNIPDEQRNVGPEWAEAVTEWCFAQPVLRRFGNSELTVTFEEIELEGKRGFKITESMPGLEGGAPVVNQFTSAEIPAPYNQFLLIKQEFQN